MALTTFLMTFKDLCKILKVIWSIDILLHNMFILLFFLFFWYSNDLEDTLMLLVEVR